MNLSNAKISLLRLAALAGLLCLAACSAGSGTGDATPGNAALDTDATANELERMANQLENEARQDSTSN